MRKLLLGMVILVLAGVSIAAINTTESSLTRDFVIGDTAIESINAISFGPEGILFLGDSKNAAIYAVDTNDKETLEKAEPLNIPAFDAKVAAALGTQAANVKITDMAVNPISKSVYLSVHITDGTPVLLRLKGTELEQVSLTNISHSKIALTNAVDKDKKDRRGRSQRKWAIADLNYHKGKVMVSGLSNKEFTSTFRSIPFPFTEAQDYASLEIWHAAHGQFETFAPIKAFNVINMNNKDYLMASYTCTPLVLFPLEDLKGGKHLKGRTVAELGSGNSPLDMITLQKGEKQYFIMSNTNRSVMRFDYESIAGFKDTMTETVEEFAVAKGVPYVSLPMVNVLQLDNLDATQVVYLQRGADGDLGLKSRPSKWM